MWRLWAKQDSPAGAGVHFVGAESQENEAQERVWFLGMKSGTKSASTRRVAGQLKECVEHKGSNDYSRN